MALRVTFLIMIVEEFPHSPYPFLRFQVRRNTTKVVDGRDVFGHKVRTAAVIELLGYGSTKEKAIRRARKNV